MLCHAGLPFTTTIDINGSKYNSNERIRTIFGRRKARLGDGLESTSTVIPRWKAIGRRHSLPIVEILEIYSLAPNLFHYAQKCQNCIADCGREFWPPAYVRRDQHCGEAQR